LDKTLSPKFGWRYIWREVAAAAAAAILEGSMSSLSPEKRAKSKIATMNSLKICF